MIDVKFVIYNKAKDKIEKVVLSKRFNNGQETEAQLFIDTSDFKSIYSRYKIDTNKRPMLYYNNTKTNEKTLLSLD